MPSIATRCAANTARGSPCQAPAVHDYETCFWHTHELAHEAHDARVRGGHNRGRAQSSSAEKFETLGTIADAVELVRIAANSALEAEPSTQRSRILLSSAMTLSRLVEAAELERRLTALEQQQDAADERPT